MAESAHPTICTCTCILVSVNRRARLSPKVKQYYLGPLLPVKDSTDKVLIYKRDPMDSNKPEWMKLLYKNTLTPLIKKIDKDWAGPDGDWVVQVNLMKPGDAINIHTDSKITSMFLLLETMWEVVG